MLRRVDFPVIGEGEHRSGWPYCMDALSSLFTPDAPVLFDDFVERTFLYDGHKGAEVQHGDMPWVGVIHHPPDLPGWYLGGLRLQNLASDKRWPAAEKNLKLIITPGRHSQMWCREQWPHIPTVSIKHPTGRATVNWTPERFAANPKPQAVQVGWFLRNTPAIFQAAVPPNLQKAYLRQNNYWANYSFELCRRMQSRVYPGRTDLGQVNIIAPLDNYQYDLLLSENVVLIEVIAAVANNAVVECIARNTPICINRHPGPVDYLGNDYPLFFDRFEEIPQVLTTDRIIAAHYYLRDMDKWWIRGGMFYEQVKAACLKYVPECRVAGWSSQREEISCEI